MCQTGGPQAKCGLHIFLCGLRNKFKASASLPSVFGTLVVYTCLQKGERWSSPLYNFARLVILLT